MNYFALLLVVVLGVAAGNLLSDWIGGQLVAYRVKQAVDERAKPARGAPARSEDKSLLQSFSPEQILRKQQEEAREQRRRDQDGVRLARACEQWRNADTQLRTETTGIEAKKHCALYDRYVNDGVLPGKR